MILHLACICNGETYPFVDASGLLPDSGGYTEPRFIKKGLICLRRNRGARIGAVLLFLLTLSACAPAQVTDAESLPEPLLDPGPIHGPALPPQPEVRLAFVGDILLGAGLAPVIAHHGFDYPWVHVAPLLQRADLAMGNLETAVTLGGTPAPDKQFTFRSRPETLQGAARAGIDVLSLANNHTLDFGQQALLETISHLRAASIHAVGAGADATEAFTPLILPAGGLQVGLLGFTRVIPTGDWAAGEQHPGLAAGYDPAPVLRAITLLAPRVDLVVVLFHWGEEVQEQPRPTDVDLAAQMVAHGAHIIVGHHPHVLQGIERRPHSLIAYSMGNFVFTSVARPLNQETGILEVTASRTGITDVRFTPFLITEGQPRPMAAADDARIWQRLDRLSRPFQTAVGSDGTVSHLPAAPPVDVR
jgi:poly-gamma-glutamate capsule biosynthesis protein CapA/YwtB (metallophosphatase superfamily)